MIAQIIAGVGVAFFSVLAVLFIATTAIMGGKPEWSGGMVVTGIVMGSLFGAIAFGIAKGMGW